MKSLQKPYFCIMWCVLTCGMLKARDVQETVLRAHKLFEQGSIEQALALYDSIEKKGPATWYNQALCYYKMGQLVQSLVCLKRAERFAAWSELPDIYYMMDQVYGSLYGQRSHEFTHLVDRVVVRSLSLFTLYGWQILFLLLWGLLLFVAARLVCRRRYFSLSSLSLLVVVLAVAVYMKHDLCNNQSGVVLKDNLLVYAGPDETFHELGSLAQAHHIAVCERQDKWLKISSGNCAGWVCDDSIALV